MSGDPPQGVVRELFFWLAAIVCGIAGSWIGERLGAAEGPRQAAIGAVIGGMMAIAACVVAGPAVLLLQ
jgi:hypothetical protein